MVETLVPRSQVAKEFGKSSRTIIRYEIDKKPGFDRGVTIAGRMFHPRSRIEAVKLLGDSLEAETLVPAE
jgi:hypothetical protein